MDSEFLAQKNKQTIKQKGTEIVNMKLVLLLLLVVVAANASVPPVGGITKENCGSIRGWLLYNYDDQPQRSQITMQVSNEEADRNANDLRLRNCCDYRDKCEFSVLEVNKQDPGRPTCSMVASCSNVDSGKLRIERTHANGWKSGQYCQNFIESENGIPMDLCRGTELCFNRATQKDSLLLCLNNLFGSSMKHAGFFATTLFPYKSFAYTQRATRNNFVETRFELTKEGKIERQRYSIPG